MGRTLDISSDSLGSLLYAAQAAALLLALLYVAFPFDSAASALLGVAFGSLVIATVVGLWRKQTGREDGTYPQTAEDITYDPFGDPGQAAKERWQKAVDRLPSGDDERD
ncbi:hypothetical protein [Halobellus rufus]|uniref:hypothetical protein n=1 Tax=Halobellus rufus TaxID=1448860 RepID=UPI0006799C07|nr:hypothetical protein [Halobellus rufus]